MNFDDGQGKELCCSFCGKRESQVRRLIAEGIDKKTALAQVAKNRKIPKRELYNQLISEGEEA